MMKKWMVLIGLASLFLCGATSASAATYYISWTNGSNSNNGTSKSTPWKCHPYMNSAGCGTPPAYTHAAGDRFIFEGGDTWPNSAFPLVAKAGGASGKSDYYGVDKTWYIGASWTRPVMDAGGTKMGSGSDNTFFDFRTNTISYVTVDNFEMKGGYWNAGAGYGWSAVSTTGWSTSVPPAGSEYVIIENCYVHGWSHAPLNTSLTVQQDSPVIFSGCWTGCELKDNVADGSDSSDNPDSSGFASTHFGSAQTVDGNVMHDMSNGIVSTAEYVYDNVIYDIRPSFTKEGGLPAAYQQHGNTIELWMGGYNGNTEGWPQVIYEWNNVIHDSRSSAVVWNVGPGASGSTVKNFYVWNNVWWNTIMPYIDMRGIDNIGGSNENFHIWNNTYVRGSSGLDDCWEILSEGPNGAGSSVNFTNNFCINTNGGGFGIYYDGGQNVTPTFTTNTVITKTTATSDGYATSNSYRPQSSGAPSEGVGTNLTSDCTGGLTPLCSDAEGEWNADGTAIGSGTNNSRPSTGAWAVGAYMYGSGSTSTSAGSNTPAPPTGLQAVVQ